MKFDCFPGEQEILSFTLGNGVEAGIFKSTYKHVPLADCIIASTAIKNQRKKISDYSRSDTIKETKRTGQKDTKNPMLR